jgi:hypothetical protein
VRGNCVDDEPQPIFAALQNRVEIAQSTCRIVEHLSEMSEFIFTLNHHLMLKLASR